MDEDLIPKDTREETTSCSQFLQWLKRNCAKYVGNVALLVAIMVYTCVGAKIFQALEFEVEMEHLISVKRELLASRSKFVVEILNLTEVPSQDTNIPSDPTSDTTDRSKLETDDARVTHLMGYLVSYENTVRTSLEEGVSLEDEPIVGNWDYTQSFFFSATVLTTVGYGNIAPSTAGGRIFCMVFALIGIPLTLSGIAVIGDILASILPLTTLQKALPARLKGFCLKHAGGKGKAIAMVLGSVTLLVAFIALGGAFFMWREDWTFMEAFYFCFISTTTIGFGDLVPDDVFFCTLYVLVGLSLTSTVIELVRRQYASSWDRMKQLSSRLHTLSGPLAEAMKRMAETGTGAVDMDIELVKELRDLNIELSKVHEEDKDNRNQEQEDGEDPWSALLNMAAKKKRITVVMYESNV